MRKLIVPAAAIALLVAAQIAVQAEETDKKAKSLQLKDLPAAVQKTVQDNLKGGQIKSISKEKEDGVEQYEIESLLSGKSRDFNVDSKGKLIVVEEATTLDAIPAQAKATISKRSQGGKVNTVETFTRPGQPTMYEAAYTDSKGKKHEVLVKADGKETKE